MKRTSNSLQLFFLFLLSVLVAACSTPTTKPTSSTDLTQEQQLARLYELARKSPPAKSVDIRIEAAELLIELNRLAEAEEILQSMDVNGMSEQTKKDYLIANADLAIYQFDGDRAISILQQLRQLRPLDTALRVRAAQLEFEAYNLQQDYIKSAAALVEIYPLFSETTRPGNKEVIWKTLLEASTQELLDNQSLSSTEDMQGWLELATLTKVNQDDLDRQLGALNNWLATWPNHPAAGDLPGELKLLSTMVTERPAKVAVLLPLNGALGAAGKYILDGLLAAYYAALETESYTPEIKIIDTSQGTDFLALYQSAVDQGAEFIIGPLDKDNLQRLQSIDLPVPTLALNYTEPPNNKANLYQFGLSGEDEARQAAHMAWQSGYRTSLVIADDSSWGTRIAKAFVNEWQQLSGNLLETQYFRGETNFSEPIRALLNIDASVKRKEQISSIIGTNPVSTPRRRSDMDFIFMVATPAQARQLKPTLAVHFAGNVPVLATSFSYSGSAESGMNRDLDGIIFSETPWVLAYQDHPIKQTVTRLWPGAVESAQISRFYALGVDSYRLIPRIRQLSQIKDSRIYGASGSLSMNNTGQLVRHLLWAQISRGEAQPIN